ncbi:nitroreductase [Paractinoplanes rishiriensis]|uniref:NAD(P)H nitroreductase n=1 Tax=Paractinoplanes rishiriensis TaxID=1050105 RepID=A0A919JWG3_9ACTN|nr:nitroreductase [Actinoplanes rishiriensis]GIE94859.1 NAD(P)H nitroreductase [Actinoplanes rishiriensis]
MTAASPSAVGAVSRRTANEAFYRAVVAAGRAPSAHNAQPWRWRLGDGVLDLFLDPGQTSEFADLAGRLATISCGAALHHARLTLAARGWRVTVTRRPDAADPAHLARLHIDGAAPVSPDTANLARAIKLRHTDLRPVTGGPIEPRRLRTICTAFEAQHVRLAVLRPDQILGLTVATANADNTEPANAQWHTELALWAGGDRIAGALDDLRLPIARGEHDRAATFAVLHGPHDRNLDWLHAGEALSAGSLVATGLKVSILPFSAPIEHADAREILRRAVPDLGYPYLMMRLGHHATETARAAHTSRLTAVQTIERPDHADTPWAASHSGIHENLRATPPSATPTTALLVPEPRPR